MKKSLDLPALIFLEQIAKDCGFDSKRDYIRSLENSAVLRVKIPDKIEWETWESIDDGLKHQIALTKTRL